MTNFRMLSYSLNIPFIFFHGIFYISEDISDNVFGPLRSVFFFSIFKPLAFYIKSFPQIILYCLFTFKKETVQRYLEAVCIYKGWLLTLFENLLKDGTELSTLLALS